MSGFGRAIGLSGLAALLLSGSGCSDYTYFNVSVSLKPTGDNYVDNSTQREINYCTVFVRHDGLLIEQGKDLRKIDGTPACRAPDTPADVGVLDYSTAKQSGKIEFIINMDDTDHATTVQGSTSADVASGKVLNLELVAAKCSSPGSCPINIK
jgi:hypothetical protein